MQDKITSKQQGDTAEALAAQYFARNGYTVLERNFKTREGEVDLVVEKGIALVFVEVRFRKSVAFGTPLDTVHHGKRRKVLLAALEWVTRHEQMNRLIRFDVLSVRDSRSGPRLEHIEDAFEANM